MEVHVYEDGAALAAAAADQFVSVVRDSIGVRGFACVALSGGSTPEAMHKLLTAPDRAGAVEWDKVKLFLGDERFVPYDDERSNFGMVQRTLLSAITIPAENLFPIPTISQPIDLCASTYASTLKRELPNGAFDLVFLGLGEDGHTASLFPGFATLEIEDRWVVATPPGTLPPPVDRITLTYPVLNASRNVVFLVSGAKKANTFRAIREGKVLKEQMPAAGIQPTNGRLLWLVDKAAAME
jgi:6-phosphogluconolactonase